MAIPGLTWLTNVVHPHNFQRRKMNTKELLIGTMTLILEGIVLGQTFAAGAAGKLDQLANFIQELQQLSLHIST